MKMKKLIFIYLGFSIFYAAGFAQTASSDSQASQTYTLDSLLTATQLNHPELLKLEEEYLRSTLDVKDAWAGLQPSLDFQASGTWMAKPPVEAIYVETDQIYSAMQLNQMMPVPPNKEVKVYDGMENTMYQLEFSLTQPIFTWGKIANSIKLYKEISSIKQTQISQQSEQLKTELTTRLISLYYLNNILQILDEEKNYTDRMVQVSENAEKVGMLLHQEVVDAKLQAKQLEISKEDLLEQIKDQLLELNRITGLENLTFEEINFDFVPGLLADFDTLLAMDAAELEAQVLSGNQSSIKILTQMESVSKTAEKISRGNENWKPDLALQMSGSVSDSRVPFFQEGWEDKKDYSLNISIGLKTTIWDGGKRLRDVSRKASEARSAQINKQDARSSLSKTFNSQWTAAQVCSMKIEYQELKIESAESKIAQKQQAYDSGYGSETDLLSAKIERCNAQIEREQQALSRAAACLTIDYLRK